MTARSVVYGKLRGRIIQIYGRYKEFAEDLGISSSGLTMRLCKRTQWKQSEILKACELLGIPKSEVCDYFFD